MKRHRNEDVPETLQESRELYGKIQARLESLPATGRSKTAIMLKARALDALGLVAMLHEMANNAELADREHLELSIEDLLLQRVWRLVIDLRDTFMATV